MINARGILSLFCLGALIACGGRSRFTDADMTQAKAKFDVLCSTCHGKTGAGDGPGSKGLTPPPRNLQESEWQMSVNDTHIEYIIIGGGGAVGKSIAMPSNPDLRGKPGVVAARCTIIRGLENN